MNELLPMEILIWIAVLLVGLILPITAFISLVCVMSSAKADKQAEMWIIED